MEEKQYTMGTKNDLTADGHALKYLLFSFLSFKIDPTLSHVFPQSDSDSNFAPKHRPACAHSSVCPHASHP